MKITSNNTIQKYNYAINCVEQLCKPYCIKDCPNSLRLKNKFEDKIKEEVTRLMSYVLKDIRKLNNGK